MDLHLAKQLVAAAKITERLMANAVEAKRLEMEEEVKKAVVARREAKEALDWVIKKASDGNKKINGK